MTNQQQDQGHEGRTEKSVASLLNQQLEPALKGEGSTAHPKGHAEPCVHCAKPIRANQYAWSFKCGDGTVAFPLHYGCGPKWYRANKAPHMESAA